MITIQTIKLNDYQYVKDPDEIVDSDWVHIANESAWLLVDLTVPVEWVGMRAGDKHEWSPRTFLKPVA